jgi:hypothetical protein
MSSYVLLKVFKTSIRAINTIEQHITVYAA